MYLRSALDCTSIYLNLCPDGRVTRAVAHFAFHTHFSFVSGPPLTHTLPVTQTPPTDRRLN